MKYFIVTVILIAIAGCSNTSSTNDQTSAEDKSELTIYRSLSSRAQSLYMTQSENFTKAVPDRLIALDEKTIGCFGAASIMEMSPTEENLGGQCCGALKNIESYDAQLIALSAFIERNGNPEFIPRDPYDVPVALAQQLTEYDTSIVLNTDQQSLYDRAMSMSHHGGPCCCKCWKWYVMSGLAKKLIVDHSWSEHQVAELWDTSSSCGHAEDTNMYQHYKVEKERDTSVSHEHEESVMN